jgi:hypothetical protein
MGTAYYEEPTIAKSLKAGDKVSWASSGGHSTGEVVKKQTTATQIKGHNVAASKDNPEYVVRSDKSGKTAATSVVNPKKRRSAFSPVLPAALCWSGMPTQLMNSERCARSFDIGLPTDPLVTSFAWLGPCPALA